MQLSFKSQVGVSGWPVAVLFLAGGGVYKFKGRGSRSRNEFRAVIYASVAAVELIFLGESAIGADCLSSKSSEDGSHSGAGLSFLAPPADAVWTLSSRTAS